MKLWIVLEKTSCHWVPMPGAAPKLNKATCDTQVGILEKVHGKNFKVVPVKIKEKHLL